MFSSPLVCLLAGLCKELLNRYAQNFHYAIYIYYSSFSFNWCISFSSRYHSSSSSGQVLRFQTKNLWESPVRDFYRPDALPVTFQSTEGRTLLKSDNWWPGLLRRCSTRLEQFGIQRHCVADTRHLQAPAEDTSFRRFPHLTQPYWICAAPVFLL